MTPLFNSAVLKGTSPIHKQQLAARPSGLRAQVAGGSDQPKQSPDRMRVEDALGRLELDLINLEKSVDGLNTDGQNLLNLIRSGAVLEGGPAAFVAGLTANFSDEIIGGITAMLGSNDELVGLINRTLEEGAEPYTGYDVGAGLERYGMEKYRTAHPGRALGFETAGAIVPGLAIPGGGQANLARVLATGVLSGALGGAGAAQDTVKERMKGAGVGSLAGGGGAGMFNLAGRVLGRGYRALTSPGAARAGVNEANLMSRQAIEADVGTMGTATSALRRAEAGGKPLVLADMGPNVRGLTDAARIVGDVGSKARTKISNFLQQRDAGAVGRITSDLQQAFGKRARFFGEFKAMSKARSVRGGRVYKRANKKFIPMDSELVELFQRGSVRRSLDKAYDIAEEQGVKMPRVRVIESGDGWRLVDADGNNVSGVKTELLHYIKMGLDDDIYSGKMPTSGIGKTELGAIKDTRGKLLNFIDSKNRTYKVARDYWAGETSAMNAMVEGRKFLRADIDELADDISRMGQSEKEAFRVGVMQAIMDKVEGSISTSNIAKNILRTEKNKRLIELTFDKTKAGQYRFNKFIENLSTEVDMKITSATVLGNSATIARQEAVQALRTGAARQIPSERGVIDLILESLRRNAKDLSDIQLRNAAERIAHVMTTTGKKGTEKIMSELRSPSGIKRLLRMVIQAPPSILGRATGPYPVGVIAGTRSQGLLDTISER